MKNILKVKMLLLILISMSIGKVYAQSDEVVRDYIERYKNVAISEQKRAGIPAAIKLAQGIHESGAGLSELAREANNHFGIKCKKDWTGQIYSYTDDSKDECFRKYYMDFESYQDHSDYLKGSTRYSSLFSLPVTDYKGWATGLRQAGYATNPKYATLLINLIEKYSLQQYTQEAAGGIVVGKKPIVEETPIKQPERKSGMIVTTTDATEQKIPDATDAVMYKDNVPTDAVVKINGLRAVYGKKGDMPLQYAVKHDVRYQKLLAYNDMKEEPLPADMPIYLERKNFLGKRSIHMVKEGETMFIVSQKEGIQLKYLRYLNDMAENEEPKVGAVLELQSMAEKKPPVIKVAPDEVEEPAPIAKAESESGYIYKEEAQKPTDIATEEIVVVAETIIEEDTKERIDTEEATAPAMEEVAETIEEENVVTEQEEEVMEKVEEIKEAIQEPEEPKSELDILKDQFDKLIYTEEKPAAPAASSTTTEETVEPDEEVEIAEEKNTIDDDPANYHTFKDGDTAFSIAKKYGISIRQLMEWNDLDFDALKKGQKLRVKPY